jgi:hypothetical protein
VTRHDSRQVTPFGHPGITARLTAPPGLSRPPTSFIGPWYQGIHRPPLPTYPPHNTHIPTDEPQTPRCSRPLCKSQPTTNPQPRTTHHHTGGPTAVHSHAWHQDNNHRHPPDPCTRPDGHATPTHSKPGDRRHGCSLRTPTGCSPPNPDPHPARRSRTTTRNRRWRVLDAPAGTEPDWPVSPPTSNRATPDGSARLSCRPHGPEVLLRKEVIQPHLPVRLPCYDFVPIASPTFDGSPPCGLGHRLRVLPTFVT